MIGLKRGTVELCAHEAAWEQEARDTISRLRQILGSAAKDIQHVGSTAVSSIKAKPIIDIAVAVERFEDVLALEGALRDAGFVYRPNAGGGEAGEGHMLFGCGSFYDGTGDLQTHFIHVVPAGGTAFFNYVHFRDYLNANPEAAREYEALKEALARQPHLDGARARYLAGKHDFIARTLRRALLQSYLGKTVTVQIDGPLGNGPAGLEEPVYRGRTPHVAGGEALDVCLLGVHAPGPACRAQIVGVLSHHDGAGDGLVAAPEGTRPGREEIARALRMYQAYSADEIEVFA